MVTLCCYLLKRKYDKGDTSNKLEGKSRVEKVVKSQIKGFKAPAAALCAVCFISLLFILTVPSELFEALSD